MTVCGKLILPILLIFLLFIFEVYSGNGEKNVEKFKNEDKEGRQYSMFPQIAGQTELSNPNTEIEEVEPRKSMILENFAQQPSSSSSHSMVPKHSMARIISPDSQSVGPSSSIKMSPSEIEEDHQIFKAPIKQTMFDESWLQRGRQSIFPQNEHDGKIRNATGPIRRAISTAGAKWLCFSCLKKSQRENPTQSQSLIHQTPVMTKLEQQENSAKNVPKEKGGENLSIVAQSSSGQGKESSAFASSSSPTSRMEQMSVQSAAMLAKGKTPAAAEHSLLAKKKTLESMLVEKESEQQSMLDKGKKPAAGQSLFVKGITFVKEKTSTDFHHSLSSISGKKPKKGLKILFVAPNLYRSHFELNQIQIRLLLQMEWVEKIYLLIPEKTTCDRKKRDLESGGKLIVQYFNLSKMVGVKQDVFYFANDEWRERTRNSGGLPNSNEVIFESFFFLETKTVKKLQKEQFDLGIAELWDYMSFPLFWLVGVKNVVATSSMALESLYYKYLGYLDSICSEGDIPELWTTFYDDHKKTKGELNFRNLHYQQTNMLQEHLNSSHEKFRKIFEKHYKLPQQLPGFEEMFNKNRYIFLNSQPFIDFLKPQPFPEKIIHFGGIALHGHQNFAPITPKDLEENQAISAANEMKGLIIISFGSIVNMNDMPDTAFNCFVDLFNKFGQYQFIWKFDENINKERKNILKRVKNLQSKEWIKQAALLENQQTRLFISHCGINSIFEAIHFSVPILCIPFIADQFYNAEALAKRGIALVVNKDDMQMLSEKVESALNPKFKDKMEILKNELNETKPAEIFLEKIEEFYQH